VPTYWLRLPNNLYEGICPVRKRRKEKKPHQTVLLIHTDTYCRNHLKDYIVYVALKDMVQSIQQKRKVYTLSDVLNMFS